MQISDDKWTDRWIQSKHMSDFGEWKVSAGKFYGDAQKDKGAWYTIVFQVTCFTCYCFVGLQTSQDARFYSISRKLDKTLSNEGKTLVIQFSVKHEQNIDCGGGYVKVMPSDANLEDFHGETNYNIMFGPDICGPGTKKVTHKQ